MSLKLGEKMYRHNHTGDFYDESWYEELLQSEQEQTEEVWVFTERQLKELIKDIFAQGGLSELAIINYQKELGL